MKPTKMRHPEKMVWPEPRTLWQQLKDAVFLIAGLFALLAVWGWQQNADAEARLEDQKLVTQKYTGLLAKTLNGEPLYDRASGTAYFFDKPVEVPLK